MLRHHRPRAVAAERRLAREHLVDHAGEAVDITRGAQLFIAARLLRTHVLRRPDGKTDFRHTVLGIATGARHAEVGQDGVAVGEQDVLGLHVAMHESLAVREVEAGPDLLCDAKRVLHGKLRVFQQAVA